jgi:hypothetical protein
MNLSGQRPSERSFGLSVGTASLVFAGLLIWRAHPRAAEVAGVAGVLLLAGGLLAPAALRIPNRLWWRFAMVLGWINSRILLTVFFFLVLTPVGCVMRLAGRSPLRSVSRRTNWSGYGARRRGSRHYEHLF